MATPLVSCVMVTRGAPRLPFVERATRAFARQTYANRELVVVLDAADDAERARTAARIMATAAENVRVVHAPGTPSLGRLRNLGIESARGDLVCVWDDDDLHHRTRLERQVEALAASGSTATFLTSMFHLFVSTRELFWTSYKRALQRCIPATGMFRRSIAARYPEDGPESMRHEDREFCLRLFPEGPVHLVDDAPHLYVYVNHGQNTSGDEFHRKMAASLSLSRGRICRARHLVDAALDGAESGMDQVSVEGSNGHAFVWHRRDA
jgi:glycosyltransferase involved in cell wall biosynthesis